MLAVARSMMSNPEIILLDEPLEGLSPLVVQELGRRIKELKQQHLTIVLCEQNINFAIDLCDYIYIIEKGTIKYENSKEEFRRDEEIKERLLLLRSSTRKLPRA